MIRSHQPMRLLWVSFLLVLLAGCTTVSEPPAPAAPAPLLGLLSYRQRPRDRFRTVPRVSYKGSLPR